jgi:Flp pilus assembly protein TadG
MSLVAVPLFGLLLGIFDFGWAIFKRSALQHSVREGVRYAVTYGQEEDAQGNELCQDDSIKQVVKRAAMGFLTGNEDKVHVRYFDPDNNFAEITGNTGNSPGNVVEVSVEDFEHRWLVPLYWSSAPLKIKVRSSDRMEGLPGFSTPPCRVPQQN